MKKSYGKRGSYKRGSYSNSSSRYAKPVLDKVPLEWLDGSDQQEWFWKSLVETQDHLMIYALPGTGKTTTLMQGLLRLDRTGIEYVKHSTILLAYNKGIAEELERKVPSWAKANTMHSLMYAVCRQAIGYRKPNKYKLDDLLDQYFPGPEEGQEGSDTWWMVRNAAKKLVSLAKGHLTGLTIENGKTIAVRPPTMEEMLAFAEKFNVDLLDKPGEILDLAVKLFEKSNADRSKMDFDDMIYWPVRFNWTMPFYMLVLVDEGQDLNFNQHEVVSRLIRRGVGGELEGRVGVVGDPNQAIYSFRGADTRSMKTLEERLVLMTNEEATQNGWDEDQKRMVNTFPLTLTRRCPKAHVAWVKAWVGSRLDGFEALPDAPEGSIESKNLMQILEDASPGQMMICRMNAPLCLVAFKLLKAGVPVKMQGTDFGGELAALISRLAMFGVKKRKRGEKVDWKLEKEKARLVDLTEFQDILMEYNNLEMEKLLKRKRNSDMQIEILTDKIACIQFLMEGLRTVGELLDRINYLFSEFDEGDAPKGFVLLSSVHRAKGLEAETVVILQPWMMPHPKAKQDWERDAESCIQVVAGTRSKDLMVLQSAG